jgi:predicted metal-binding membrane protein
VNATSTCTRAGTSLRAGTDPAFGRTFLGVSALLFAASTATTIAWCASMSTMADIPMPGGRSVSMAWIPMCGRSWLEAGASFLGMWTLMMVAMMLPSLVPMLGRYRRAVEPAGGMSLGGLTVVVGTSYLLVWTLFGMAAFPFGALLVMAQLRVPALAQAAPLAAGLIVVTAGIVQCTAWKARQLACCRGTATRDLRLATDAGTAWRHGLRLGRHCVACCASLTAVLLVIGVMDLWAMAVISIAISIERLIPASERAAQAIGVGVLATGLFLIGRAIGLG